MFKILEVKPMFTGVITTAKRYVGDMTTKGGLLLDTSKMEGTMNPFQTVIAAGDMVKDLKPGDIVNINFKRYKKTVHAPGAIENNITSDNMSITYEIPMIELGDQEALFLQNSDIEFIVTKYKIDEGGLLQ